MLAIGQHSESEQSENIETQRARTCIQNEARRLRKVKKNGILCKNVENRGKNAHTFNMRERKKRCESP